MFFDFFLRWGGEGRKREEKSSLAYILPIYLRPAMKIV
jgi:hypothetical protein